LLPQLLDTSMIDAMAMLQIAVTAADHIDPRRYLGGRLHRSGDKSTRAPRGTGDMQHLGVAYLR